MQDFSLVAYAKYLRLLLDSGNPFIRFDELMQPGTKMDRFIIARHDVDRRPSAALKMARVENGLGVNATYYFRFRRKIFDPKIVVQIAEMGHEIGYHYECLSDSKGNLREALDLFKKNLSQMRKIVPVKTISMHGRPLSPYDNRDMWADSSSRASAFSDLGLLGEVYLDINYGDIAYINDTGRNWSSTQNNRRDMVCSNIDTDFSDASDLVRYLQSPHKKTVFQIHPERWSDGELERFVQIGRDAAVNMAKGIVKKLRL